MRRLFIGCIAIAAISLLGVGIGARFAWNSLHQTIGVPQDGVILDVAPGTAFGSLARELASDGIVPSARVLSAYARWSGEATRVQAGEYLLTSDLTALSLLGKLSSGDVVMHQFTIIEGWRFSEMLRNLRLHPAVIADSLTGPEIMIRLGREGLHPEGQFLPDTYLFPKGTREIAILERANNALQNRLDIAWARRPEDSVLHSPYEALTLASIIEKETALASERPLISGVFHERLRRRMRLQTDPTVIYGLGDLFDGNLRRRDLNADTPYNTYTRYGLPPTPIALPSGAAIDAAVEPISEGALYFVATGEPDGSHAFSRTIDEHNEAVRNYLRRQRDE